MMQRMVDSEKRPNFRQAEMQKGNECGRHSVILRARRDGRRRKGRVMDEDTNSHNSSSKDSTDRGAAVTRFPCLQKHTCLRKAHRRAHVIVIIQQLQLKSPFFFYFISCYLINID